MKTKDFSCEQCQYKATRKVHLLSHMESVHEGTTFPCEQGDYKARCKSELLKHIKSIHEGVKFQCDRLRLQISTQKVSIDT